MRRLDTDDLDVRGTLAVVSTLVGGVLTYYFGPVVGIAYVCFLVTWFGT